MNKFELEVNEENIKNTLTHNILDRNSKLVKLAEILDNINENVIISIDGNWGTGKTFFIKQLQYLIEHVNELNDCRILSGNEQKLFEHLSQTNLVVYYNAWENDNQDSALESLLYNILNDYSRYTKNPINSDAVAKLAQNFIFNFIKSSSKDIIDLEELHDTIKLDNLVENVKTTENKKETLNKLINKMTENGKRIILIIDELDRCKPSFAVDILETIKHFYINKKMTIIISTNSLELSNTIRKFYGNDFNAYGYLDKFFDLSISLGQINISKYIERQKLITNSSFNCDDISKDILKYYNFSLRECNRYMTIYKILCNYINKKNDTNDCIYCIFIQLAIALKIQDLNLYNIFITGKGKNIINDFFKYLERTNPEYIKVLSNELLNNKQSNYLDIINEFYLKIFTSNEFTFKYNAFEVLSLLGTQIII